MRNKVQRLKLKRQLIDELGGKCIDCGYNKHLAALDFDHIDSNKKKFHIGAAYPSRSISSIKKELENCVIRCANCHRIKTYPTATV